MKNLFDLEVVAQVKLFPLSRLSKDKNQSNWVSEPKLLFSVVFRVRESPTVVSCVLISIYSHAG